MTIRTRAVARRDRRRLAVRRLTAAAFVPALLVAGVGVAGAQAPPPPAAAPDTWRIDITHSELSFRIRHIVSRVRGTFREWSGTLTVDPGRLAAGSVEVTIQAASIFTANERRDDDLRSANFFDVATYPVLSFRSRGVAVEGTRLRVEGDLTIRDVTKAVVLEGEYLGLSPSARGDRIGFEARTMINRLDWGLTWNRALEGGGLLLGDDVEISLAVAAVRGPTAR